MQKVKRRTKRRENCPRMKNPSLDWTYHRMENERLGSGRFGDVFGGTLVNGHQTIRVAYKNTMLDLGKCFETDSSLKSVNHLFVVKFYGFHEEGEIRWLVMGRCDENLDQYLKRSWSNKPNEFDPKLILVQTTVALSYLHGLDVVHGDLRPRNVLVQQMAPKITLFQLSDYGLGRRHHSTPATCYEAPELHSAHKEIREKPTAQSDVWALGVLAFYVLSRGKLPFGDADVLDPDTFMTKWEIVCQAEPLFRDWAAAELVSNLLRWNPEERCKSYLIIHQPYFSLTNESSLLFLAKQVYDLFPIYGGSFERNDYEQLFRSLDKSLRSTENEQFFEKLFESICYTNNTIDNRPEFTDLMNSIKLSPKHFAGYFCYFLKTFDWETDEFENHEDERSRTIKKLGSLFQVTGLMAAMIFYEESDFAIFWLNSKASVQEEEQRALSYLAAALSKENTLALVAEGCNLKSLRNVRWRNIVYFAVMMNNYEITRILLENGAEAEDERCHPLRYAITYVGNAEITRLLLQHGAAVNNFVDGEAPLHLAVKCNSIEKVRILLEHGASVSATSRCYCNDPVCNEPDNFAETPLHVAARCNSDPQIVRLLLRYGASVHAVCTYDRTPLHVAAGKGNCETVRILLEHDASMTAVDGGGCTPFHLAAESGTPDVVQLLIDRGASVASTDWSGQSPIHLAASHNGPQVMTILMDSGASAMSVDREKRTPLHHAASWNRNLEVLKMLMEHGASLAAVDSQGQTPLHRAAANRCSEVIRLLLKHGACVTAVDNQGKKPIDLVPRNRYKESKIQLLEKAELYSNQ